MAARILTPRRLAGTLGATVAISTLLVRSRGGGDPLGDLAFSDGEPVRGGVARLLAPRRIGGAVLVACAVYPLYRRRASRGSDVLLSGAGGYEN
ncbi:hypothetical protein G3I60_24340 [Streptomyces sp. SID13666]|uniref:hypothetical protein n=1 Tax=unclassified Streptomyces TaxID=2593676 RepID=UPI001105772D|nr:MULTISPECIES: hypothetical protein [unclassified Streptomyces]NEA57192.1 hypothetical protein [Streptomyces sp. SID13666]NEA74286.1 hypothetical protein [Streptomyces sp. SID13588]QNA71954.1 hypothetical protein C8250_008605 [Streptomyces sp. So13.3]